MEFLGNKFLTSSGESGPSVFDGVKVIGIYFSAHWCPPCRGFTPMLAEWYNEVNKSEKVIEIVFNSCDQNQEQFESYFASMPWVALPYQGEGS